METHHVKVMIGMRVQKLERLMREIEKKKIEAKQIACQIIELRKQLKENEVRSIV